MNQQLQMRLSARLILIRFLSLVSMGSSILTPSAALVMAKWRKLWVNKQKRFHTDGSK
jgi:hypothetical protein